MPRMQLLMLAAMAMLAFAANSLLCRVALAGEYIDAATFTLVRIAAGATVLCLLLRAKSGRLALGGSYLGGAALFGYAGAFSFAYVNLSTGTGALLLFGAVQVSMIGYGLWSGEHLRRLQFMGGSLAFAGLIWLLLPGVEAPPMLSAFIMLAAGLCWAVYSIIGKRASDPTAATAGNFLRATPFALLLFILLGNTESLTATGILCALASGALASGLGYALWYAVLPLLPTSTAATIQLSVPVLAALGGALFLNEALNLRFAISAIAVLGGIGVFIISKPRTT